jgi:hypothetical protein
VVHYYVLQYLLRPSCSHFLYKNVVHYYVLQYLLSTNVTYTLLSIITTINLLINILQLCISKTYTHNVPYLTPLLAAEDWHKCNRNSFNSFGNLRTDRAAIFVLQISEYFSHIAERTSHIAHVVPRRNITALPIRGTHFGFRSFLIQILMVYYWNDHSEHIHVTPTRKSLNKAYFIIKSLKEVISHHSEICIMLIYSLAWSTVLYFG